MTQLNIDDLNRAEHPLDVVERLASLRDWIFDRAETDEMSVAVAGRCGSRSPAAPAPAAASAA